MGFTRGQNGLVEPVSPNLRGSSLGRRTFEFGEITEVIYSFETAQVGIGVVLECFKAKRAAQLDQVPVAIHAREAASTLHVFAAHGAGRHVLTIADCVFDAHSVPYCHRGEPNHPRALSPRQCQRTRGSTASPSLANSDCFLPRENGIWNYPPPAPCGIFRRPGNLAAQERSGASLPFRDAASNKNDEK